MDTEVKCPKCGQSLVFNSDSNVYKCDNCKIDFDINSVKNQSTNNNYEYVCNDCGFTIITPIDTNISSCIYCKSNNIEKKESSKKIPEVKFIPFKIDNKKAQNIYKQFCSKRFLKPSVFSNKKSINEIIGAYVPFYLYNCDSNGVVELNCKKNTSWKTGSYKYKKIDTYLVTRSGNMSFENIPIDTTKKFIDIVDLIGPFDFSEREKSDISKVSSYPFIPNKMTNDEILRESVGKAKGYFIKEMIKSVDNYKEITPIKNSINLYNSKISSVLLPIYILNIKYKDKMYNFSINGQTGKISGNIPISIKKAIVIWIILFIVILLVSSLIIGVVL